MTQNGHEVQEQITQNIDLTNHLEIDSEKSCNAFSLKIKGTLSKSKFKEICRLFDGRFYDKKYTFPIHENVPVEAYFKENGIDYEFLGYTHDEYHGLSEEEKRLYRINLSKTNKLKNGIKTISKLEKCIQDYNKIWGTRLTKKNIYYANPDNLIELATTQDPKQFENLKTLYEITKKIKDDQKESLELSNKIESIEKEISGTEKKQLFHVLGFNNQRQILIWYKGKILPIPVRQLQKDELKLLVGILPIQEISPNSDSQQNHPCPYAILRSEIIAEAHEKGLVDDDEPIKSGIWKFKDEWLIVSGKRAAIIKKDNLNYLETPIFHDRIIEFERGSWIDLNSLEKKLKNPNIKNAFNKVKDLVSKWCWQHEGMIDFVSANIMLQLFQNAMRWRSWNYLLGAAGTGKSSFIEHVIERLFGCLVKRLDKSTAHATAQSIGGSGKVAIFDEFEKNKHLSDVLELLKLCNRGGRKTSGTTTEKANEYALHHLVWLASIYLPKTFSSDQAQLSRVVKFELKKIPEGKFIVGLSDQEAQDLLCEIVAAIVSEWPKIDSLSEQIERNKERYINECSGKIDGRCVENLMYAMALISIVSGEEQKIPEWAIQEVKDDGENILDSILSAKVRHINEEYRIIDLINKALDEPININITQANAKSILRKNGLSVVQKNNGWCLAVRCRELTETILKNHGDYKGVDIKAPLERLEGVEKNKKTDWGEQVKQWALHIPGYHVNNLTG